MTAPAFTKISEGLKEALEMVKQMPATDLIQPQETNYVQEAQDG